MPLHSLGLLAVFLKLCVGLEEPDTCARQVVPLTKEAVHRHDAVCHLQVAAQPAKSLMQVQMHRQQETSQESSAVAAHAGLPKVLIITVPGRAQSDHRMERLRPRLVDLGLEMAIIEGPNMEKYCPANIQEAQQSKKAGMQLLLKEWKGRTPDLKTYDLQLFQMATLVGHLRAWKHISESNESAVVMEDDADISSTQDLENSLQSPGANAILLDKRHCWPHVPPNLDQMSSGLAGYWLDPKAATALLEHFPLNIPVDWGVNAVFNTQIQAICPTVFPLTEHGGEKFARQHSAAHGCGKVNLIDKTANPVAMLLSVTVKETLLQLERSRVHPRKSIEHHS